MDDKPRQSTYHPVPSAEELDMVEAQSAHNTVQSDPVRPAPKRHPRRPPGIIPCEEMIDALAQAGIPIEEIAKFANVHPNTIKFIKIGITRSPLYATGKAIEFLYEIYIRPSERRADHNADQDPL